MSASQDTVATDTGVMSQYDSERDASYSSERTVVLQPSQIDRDPENASGNSGTLPLGYSSDLEDMLDNFQQDNLETAEVMAIELLHQDNLPPLHRVYGHLVLAHGTIDALYHAFRAFAIAREGLQDLGDNFDREEMVEVFAFAERVVQKMLDRGFGQVTQTVDVRNEPVLEMPEPETPRTPRRSLRLRSHITPMFSEQKSPKKCKSPRKRGSGSPKKRKPKSPRKQKAVAADAPNGTYYTIRGILDESETGYLVDWQDIDSQSFSPTWEPKGNVTSLAIQLWVDGQKKMVKR